MWYFKVLVIQENVLILEGWHDTLEQLDTSWHMWLSTEVKYCLFYIKFVDKRNEYLL